jgi:hypothetical protein
MWVMVMKEVQSSFIDVLSLRFRSQSINHFSHGWTIPSLQACTRRLQWYNNRLVNNKGYINDKRSILLGMPRMKQNRVQHGVYDGLYSYFRKRCWMFCCILTVA